MAFCIASAFCSRAMATIERQVRLKLRLVEVHIVVCMFESLDGIKYIVKRPKHWVLCVVSEAEGYQAGGDAVAPLFQQQT